MQFYIVRHGQSVSNAQKVVAGSVDAPLSELGVKQSELAADTARNYFDFDLIATSPLTRAQQTAQIFAKKLGLDAQRLLTLENLRERNLGALEGLNYADAPQYNGNYEDAEGAVGIESLEHLFERAAAALQELQHYSADNVLIVCHNGIGRMLRAVAAHQAPQDMYRQPRLENAVIYELAGRE